MMTEHSLSPQGVLVVVSNTVITTRSVSVVLKGIESAPLPPEYNCQAKKTILKKSEVGLPLSSAQRNELK